LTLDLCPLNLGLFVPPARRVLRAGRSVYGEKQLLGFGVEKQDDAVEALVYLILGLVRSG